MRIKSKTGFVGGGLLGVLGFSLVGLTIAMGNYKLNTRSINSTNVESVASSEKALGKTLINILNNDDYCRQYLTGKPEERISVLNVGNFKNEGFINIIDIDVLPTNAPPFPKKKTLYVYYKKPALGANEIRQGKHDNNQPYKCEPDDENSNKKGDKRGCYHVSCEINYTCSKADRNSNTDCSNDDDPSNIITSCAPANCFPKKPEPKISSCDPNEIKTGITPCDTIPANIFNSDEMRQLNPDTTQTIKAFTGFKTSESRIKPDAIEVSKTCPEGQYPVRKTDGTTVCQIMCTGGSILTNTNPPLCVCPDDKPIYKQGVCQRCPTSFIWNPDLEGGPGCDCPSNHHLYIKNGVARCITCPTSGYSRSHWSNGKCVCDDSKYIWIYEPDRVNKCDCPPRKYFFSGACVPCIDGTWNETTGRCDCTGGRAWNWPGGEGEIKGRCECLSPSNPIWHNNQCTTCGGGSKWTWSVNKCTCLDSDKTFDHIRNECIYPPCQSGQHYSVQRQQCITCSHPNIHFFNGICRRCRGDQYWSTTREQCITCRSPNIYFYEDKCQRCPGGKEWSTTIQKCQCPTAKPHWHLGSRECNRCPEGQHYYDNKCHRCPRGQYFSNRYLECVHCSSRDVTFEYTDNGNHRCVCNNPAFPSFHAIFNRNTRSREGYCGACPAGVPWDGSKCPCDIPGEQQIQGGIMQVFVKNERLTIKCLCGSVRFQGGQLRHRKLSHTLNKCIWCPQDATWNETTGRCDCPAGKRWWYTIDSDSGIQDGSQCIDACGPIQFPGGQTFQRNYSHTLNKCIWCPQDATWNETTGRCDCPAEKKWWYFINSEGTQNGSKCIDR